MKSRRLLPLLGLPLVLSSCVQSGEAASDSRDLDMIAAKFDDYHQGDWERWITYYADSARVFYNTRTEAMTAREAAQMHEASVVGLSSYGFGDDFRIERVDSGDGTARIWFTGYWRATFADGGASFETPTAAYYRLRDGLIVEEHGFWDNTIYVDAAAAGTND